MGQDDPVGLVEQPGGDRGRAAPPGVEVVRSAGQLPGVLQLQQLDRPLDVGQPAAAELEVPGRVGAARQPLRLDPAP